MEKGDCLPDARSAVVAIEPSVDVRDCNHLSVAVFPLRDRIFDGRPRKVSLMLVRCVHIQESDRTSTIVRLKF